MHDWLEIDPWGRRRHVLAKQLHSQPFALDDRSRVDGVRSEKRRTGNQTHAFGWGKWNQGCGVPVPRRDAIDARQLWRTRERVGTGQKLVEPTAGLQRVMLGEIEDL